MRYYLLLPVPSLKAHATDYAVYSSRPPPPPHPDPHPSTSTPTPYPQLPDQAKLMQQIVQFTPLPPPPPQLPDQAKLMQHLPITTTTRTTTPSFRNRICIYTSTPHQPSPLTIHPSAPPLFAAHCQTKQKLTQQDLQHDSHTLETCRDMT